MGQGAGRTHPGHQRALQEELHELRDRHVHAEAAPAGSTPGSPAPRYKAALAASGGRGAAAARTRETKAGREPTFRGFGGPAPRPGLGEGEGPPLGEEQCGRQPRPSAALGSRCAASRCRGPERGRGRGCAGRGEGRGPHVYGREGSPCRVPGNLHVGPQPRAQAERSLKRSGPQHVAPRGARARLRRAGTPSAGGSPRALAPLCLPGGRAGGSRTAASRSSLRPTAR